MSAPIDRRANIATVIFDMDDDVASMIGWAKVIYDLGASGSDIDSAGLFEIGKAMLERARKVKADWQVCFDLTKDMPGGGR